MTQPALSLVPPASQAAAGAPAGFSAFDDRLGAGLRGLLVVRAAPAVHAALAGHAQRRLRAGGRSVVAGRPGLGSSTFGDVAARLGAPGLAAEAARAAERLETLLGAGVVLAPLPETGSWDHDVLVELARRGEASIVLFAPPGAVLGALEGSAVDVAESLTTEARGRWFAAVLDEATSDHPSSHLASLDAWWRAARAQDVPDGAPLAPAACPVVELLALAGRALPEADVRGLTADGTLAAALRTGAVVRDAGFVALAVSAARAVDLLDAAEAADGAPVAPSRSAERARAVATCLERAFPGDGWALLRAAELRGVAGDVEKADADYAAALWAHGGAPSFAGEAVRRWREVLAHLASPEADRLRLAAARRALRVGEAHEALSWCEGSSDPEARVVAGEAHLGTGDLVAARVALEAVVESAAPLALRERAGAHLAEIEYLGGKPAEARARALALSEPTTDTAARLAARNVLGKLLLAQSEWAAADAHFAADSQAARDAGQLEPELRASVNRAIALLSMGRMDESVGLLEETVRVAEGHGELRALVAAYANLAVASDWRHAYVRALECWERSVSFGPAAGRTHHVMNVVNLAELRLRLGLLDQAEQTLLFLRRALPGGLRSVPAARVATTHARIALERGRTETARRELKVALTELRSGLDPECASLAHVLLARASFDDGDLDGARAALAAEHLVGASEDTRAEAALVEALLARSRGDTTGAQKLATGALVHVRASGSARLLVETCVLLAQLARDAGDVDAARGHASRAVAARDQAAGDLPPELRAPFLSRVEMVNLGRLQLALGDGGDDEMPRTLRAPIVTPGGRELVGDDPAIRALLGAVRKVARSTATVLVRGESGSGKELVAEALHRASERANGPFVAVNCSALVETLLLSELFGHEKGAFTGASARRRGRFEMAEGGTLFLDEIGDISARTQVALLRVLQEKTFERVGGTTPLRANVRVVCATHRDLRAMVERGEFREDLYYRLRGITLEVPALRARPGDLPRLVDHLLGRIAAERNEQPKVLARDALELLARHRWPGNVRELDNVLRAVALFAEGETITLSDVVDNVDELRTLARTGQGPISLRGSLAPPPPSDLLALAGGSVTDMSDDEGDDSVELPIGEANATAVAYAQVRQGTVSLSDIKRQIERDCIARALAETSGNITRAAALLGMKRPRLSQLVKQYGLGAGAQEAP